MTRAEWDSECRAQISALVAVHIEPGRAIRLAHERMERVFGPRPEDVKPQGDEAGAPWWLRVGVGLFLGGQMDKVKAFVNRYAVLVSVIYLALLGLAEALKSQGVEWAAWAATIIGTLGGLFSITPAPEVVSAVPLAIGSGVALYGAVVKIVKLIKAPKA